MGRIHFKLSHWFSSNPKAITHHHKQEDNKKLDANYNHDGANHKTMDPPFLSETPITSPKLSVTSSNILLISPNQSILNSSTCISPKDHMNRSNIIECNNATTNYTDHSLYHHSANHDDDCVFNQLIDDDECYESDSNLKVPGSLSHGETRSEDGMNDKQKRKDGFDVRELERRLKALINEHPEPLGRRKYYAKFSTDDDNSPILSDNPPTPLVLVNPTADYDQYYASIARRHSMDSSNTSFSQIHGDLLHLGNDIQSRNHSVSTIMSTSTNSDTIFDPASACASIATTFDYHGVSEISNICSNQPSISSSDDAEDVVTDLNRFDIHNYSNISENKNCSSNGICQDHNSIRSAILRELALSHVKIGRSKQPNASEDDPISEQVNYLNATNMASGSSIGTSYAHNSPILWDGIMSRRDSEIDNQEEEEEEDDDDDGISRAFILPARPKIGNNDVPYHNGFIKFVSGGHGHDDNDDDHDADMNVHRGDLYLSTKHSHDFYGKKDHHGFDELSRRRARICPRKDNDVSRSTYLRCKERLLGGAGHMHYSRAMARLSGPRSSSDDCKVREPWHGPRQYGAGSDEEENEEALRESEDILPTDFYCYDDDDHYHSNVRPSCRVSDSVAVVKLSHDPGRDFKESMLDMVGSSRKNIRGGYSYSARDMVELLQCYLALNSDAFHGLIFKAFTEVWSEVFNQSSSSPR